MLASPGGALRPAGFQNFPPGWRHVLTEQGGGKCGWRSSRHGAGCLDVGREHGPRAPRRCLTARGAFPTDPSCPAQAHTCPPRDRGSSRAPKEGTAASDEVGGVRGQAQSCQSARRVRWSRECIPETGEGGSTVGQRPAAQAKKQTLCRCFLLPREIHNCTDSTKQKFPRGGKTT